MEWGNAAIGISLLLLAMGAFGFVLVRQSRMTARLNAQAEAERLLQWDATVVRSEVKQIPTGGGARRIPMIVVYYRRDDGVDSHVMQYENEAMTWAYKGALAYYRFAPTYKELETWAVGDRLHKPSGEHFPHKVAAAPST